MGRKVFLTVLGTGPYNELNYKSENFSSSNKYIQIATLDYLLSVGIKIDTAIVMLTDESEKKYWEDNDLNIKGLGSCLKDFQYPIEIVPVKNIPNGINENEIKEIFSRVFEVIETGDELYFDVTHGFRYLPMLVMILINYSRYLKQTQIKSISYGMLIDREKGEGAIIDLNSLYDLQRLTEAGHGTVFGTLKEYIDMLPDIDKGTAMYDFKKGLISLEDAIATSNIKKLKQGKCIIAIRNNKKAAIAMCPDRKQQIEDIISFTSDFIPAESNTNIEIAIKWTFDHHMMSQAFTMAQEYIKMLFAEKIESISPYEKKDKSRLKKYMVGCLLAIDREDFESDIFKDELETFPDFAKHVLSLQGIWELKDIYERLRKTRNDLNHGNGVDLTLFTKAEDLYVPYKEAIENIQVI